MDKKCRAMELLEALTPNGSEFVNDPEACYEFVCRTIDRLEAQLKKAIKDRKNAESNGGIQNAK